MFRLLPRLALPALLLGLAWFGWQSVHQPPAGLSLDSGAHLEWSKCWFDTPLWRPVHCGHLTTAPHSGAEPASFRLPVVYAPAYFWKRTRPPVIHVAGGPGGATGLDREIMPGWLRWLDDVDWPADVVLYDQRGVGLAEPQPTCGELDDVRRALLDSDLSSRRQYEAIREATVACRDRLQRERWDLSRFSTPHNADDLLDLVATLGLEQWQLYAVSYGTRMALEVQRRDPPGLQALVLDSVYPPQVHGEAANPWLLNRSLRLFTRSCELLDDCPYRRERLAADLEDILHQLRHSPLQVELRDPDNGQALPITLDHEDLAWLVFESQYLWHNLGVLPGALDALAQGQVSADMRRMLQESVDVMFDPTLNEAVTISVDCADNGPLPESVFDASRREFPLVSDLLVLDWRYGACRDWRSGDVGAAFRQPVHGTQPTLLLSGEFDPVTPPQWAQLAADTQQHAYHLTFPGIGHGVLDSDACAVDVVRAFWRDPQAPAVPACLDPR